MSHFEQYGSTRSLHRNAVIIGSVVVAHALGLWALQSGLLRQAVEVIVPAQVLSEFLTPPPPPPPPPPPVPAPPVPPPPVPVRQPPTPPKPKAPPPRPAPMPVAIPDPTPAPAAPVSVIEPQPPAPPILAPVAPPPPAPPAPSAAPAQPTVVPPSSSASYLNNPAPQYPAVSRRLGEQGMVVLRVLIGTDGAVQKVEIKQSSGFERLDQQAVKTVSRWRFAPGTRNGVPEAMWHLQPINFVLTH